MTITYEQSLARYDEAKKHFEHIEGQNATILISDLPMNDWIVHYHSSEKEMRTERLQLYVQNIPYVSVGIYNNLIYFQYSDRNLFKVENLLTNEIIDEEDLRPFRKLQEVVRNEFKSFVKHYS